MTWKLKQPVAVVVSFVVALVLTVAMVAAVPADAAGRHHKRPPNGKTQVAGKIPITTYRYKNSHNYEVLFRNGYVVTRGTIVPDADGTGGLMQGLRIYTYDDNNAHCADNFETSGTNATQVINNYVSIYGMANDGSNRTLIQKWTTPNLTEGNNCVHTYPDIHVNRDTIQVIFNYHVNIDGAPDHDGELGFTGDTNDYTWDCDDGTSGSSCSRDAV